MVTTYLLDGDVNKDSRLKDKDQGLEFKVRKQGLST